LSWLCGGSYWVDFQAGNTGRDAGSRRTQRWLLILWAKGTAKMAGAVEGNAGKFANCKEIHSDNVDRGKQFTLAPCSSKPMTERGRRMVARLLKRFRRLLDGRRAIDRVLKRFRKLKRRKRKAPASKPRPLYQAKRSQATEQRLDLISARLDERDQSLLDIGCNLGRMTRFAADKGLLALGIDSGRRPIADACEANRDVPHLAFMRSEITPEMVTKLPSFDVILCLSVYHYWMELYGETAAWSMVTRLIERSRRKFFFEPASLLKKYGAHPPPGVADLDREGLLDYHMTRLREAAGAGWTVTHLGETPALGPESFRLLFLVTRSLGG
jgi:SAM-dependent methyltransferase